MIPLEQVVSELNRLKAGGLVSDYAIGGAIAAQANGIEVSATEDVDVFVVFTGPEANTLAPLGPIWADLTAHGAKQDNDRLVIGGWPVHFLPPGRPLYDEAISSARTKEFGAQVGRIIGPVHLSAIAVDTGRPAKDYVRVVEFLQRGIVARADLEAMVRRFGLTEKWDRFRSKFLDEK